MPVLVPEDVAAAQARLDAARVPYALATVVWTAGLSSGKPGARAVITEDGTLHGWVGGACTLGAVVRTAKEALATDEPVVLRVGPERDIALVRDAADDHRRTSLSRCASEGTYEVFIEPHRPKPQLIVLGDTPVAATLCRLARVVDFDVVAGVKGPAARPEAHRTISGPDLSSLNLDDNTWLVVATMGQWDKAALESAVSSEVEFVALVASPKRWARLREGLLTRHPQNRVDRVIAPGGLDLGPVPHHEIAVSLLAQIVQAKAARARAIAQSPISDAVSA